MAELHLCACGHDRLSHASLGPCMDTDCGCALYVEPMTHQVMSGWSLWTADPARERHVRRMRRHAEDHARCQWLLLWAAQQEAEARTKVAEAKARLLTLAWWLTAVCVPVLVAAVCWAVVG